MRAFRAYAWMALVEAIMGLAVAHYLKIQMARWLYRTVSMFRW